jgi:transposase-like protein
MNTNMLHEPKSELSVPFSFQRAIGTTKVAPVEVVTDRAATYPIVLEELLPAAWHRTEQYANNRVEADHGWLKARLRPMRDSSRTPAPG